MVAICIAAMPGDLKWACAALVGVILKAFGEGPLLDGHCIQVFARAGMPPFGARFVQC
jgi:hypothetical protein